MQKEDYLLKAEWHKDESNRHLREAEKCDLEFKKIRRCDNDASSIIDSFLEEHPLRPREFLRDKLLCNDHRWWIAHKVVKDPRIAEILKSIQGGCPCCIIGEVKRSNSDCCDICSWDANV
jgi:hypothetical protein